MMATSARGSAGKLAAAALVACAGLVGTALLSIESERGILVLLLALAAGTVVAGRSGALGRWSRGAS